MWASQRRTGNVVLGTSKERSSTLVVDVVVPVEGRHGVVPGPMTFLTALSAALGVRAPAALSRGSGAHTLLERVFDSVCHVSRWSSIL